METRNGMDLEKCESALMAKASEIAKMRLTLDDGGRRQIVAFINPDYSVDLQMTQEGDEYPYGWEVRFSMISIFDIMEDLVSRDGKLYDRYNDQFLTEDDVFDLCLDEAMERTEKDIKNEMKELEETEEWGKINDDAAENH